MILEGPFYEIGAILVLALLVGAVVLKLRQPLIIAYLATGILAGPSGLGIVRSYEQIELLAQIGIALLLFIVGLKLDLNVIRTTGPVALATGVGQIIFTCSLGFLIALAIGRSVVTAAYIAVAITFSSTIIVVKLLSDKREIDSLHGQIAVGLSVVQSVAAILAMVALTTFFGSGEAGNDSAMMESVLIGVQGFGLLASVWLLMRYVLPRVLRRLAYSQETLVLFAVAWAVFLGAVSEMLGFTTEIGAFLAGVSLASSEYRDSIAARLTSLRDFLLLFFFIDLGARMDWSAVGSEVPAAVGFSVFVLIGNPLSVILVMGFMGYRRRTSFLAGLTVAQISEFSLIVVALGLRLGHIGEEVMGLVTLVAVMTIFACTYMILHSETLYRLLSGALKRFERRVPYREAAIDTTHEVPPVDVILVGLGNYGSGIARHLLDRGKTVVGVDFEPEALEKWRSRGMMVLYGDMGDPEIHEQLPIDKARWIVSTVRSKDLNLALLHLSRSRGYGGRIALAAANEMEAGLFREAGADVVLRPFIDAAEQAADALTYATDVLPRDVDWPITFHEVRLKAASAFAGKTLKTIPLRSATHVSVLAVSRAGRVYSDPGPDFQVQPGDRLVLMGTPQELRQAEILLNQVQETPVDDMRERFVIAEIPLAEDSGRIGQTLAELQFRQEYNATVVGIRRDERRITTPHPNEELRPGDRLVVIGTAPAIKRLKELAPF